MQSGLCLRSKLAKLVKCRRNGGKLLLAALWALPSVLFLAAVMALPHPYDISLDAVARAKVGHWLACIWSAYGLNTTRDETWLERVQATYPELASHAGGPASEYGVLRVFHGILGSDAAPYTTNYLRHPEIN